MVVAATTLLVLLLFGQPAEPTASGPLAVFSAANLADNAGLLLFTALGAATVIGVASLVRTSALKSGGGQVARDLGGQKVDPDTRGPKQRQLLNVVEEIAIASGTPVPEVYVLEQEAGINAFAAGYTPGNAAVAVTRGTLDKLDRAELQGVIAHEFSHVINGDMRLNIQMMGAAFGILVLALIGRKLLRHGFLFGGGRRRNQGVFVILAIGIGLLVIGYIGVFSSRWIKAGVSRQRESLADASAVQYTRHPEGIAGALKKIAVYESGSHLDAEVEEVNHMLFGEGRVARLFATHPPLVERIRAIEPQFHEGELKTLARRLAEAEQQRAKAQETTEEASAAAQPSAAEKLGLDADSLIDNIGNPDRGSLLQAAVLAAAVPEPLAQAARRGEQAPALLLSLLLDADAEQRQTQLDQVEALMGAATRRQVARLADGGAVEPGQRLPLLEMAQPALRRLPRGELLKLRRAVHKLAAADRRIEPFEFLLAQVLRVYLAEALGNQGNPQGGRVRLARRRAAAGVSLAALAHFGHPDDRAAAQRAFDAGAEATGLELPGHWPDSPNWPRDLERALQALDALGPQGKDKLVRGWVATVMHDGTARTRELEMLRACCASIQVPLPLAADGGAKPA